MRTKVLQKAQNSILKMLFNLNKRTNTSELHKNNSVLNILELCKVRTLLIGHEVIYFPSELNVAHDEIQRNVVIGRDMRNDLNLRVTADSYSVHKKVSENICVLWNEIPREIKNIFKRDKFKESLKNKFLNSYQAAQFLIYIHFHSIDIFFYRARLLFL